MQVTRTPTRPMLQRRLTRAMTEPRGEVSIRSMFASNEQGVHYDPSDFERYMADKGPELLQDPSFNDPSKWGLTQPTSGVASISGGNLRLNSADGTYCSAIPASAGFPGIVDGAWYEYEIEITAITGQHIGLNIGGASQSPNLTTVGVHRGVLRAVGTSKPEIKRSGAGVTVDATISRCSVRELTNLATCSLYQDSAGTTPVTAMEQPVGLTLDKRLGAVRGVELVSNGTFGSDLTGWNAIGTPGWTWVGGKASLTGDGTAQTLSQPNVFVVGKTYEISFDVTASSSAIGFQNAGATIVASGSSGTVRVIWTADTTSLGFKRSGGTVNGTLDNISVREIPGNHATQSTAAARPVLSARKNLLTQTEDFTQPAWGKNFVTVTANATTNPVNGMMDADLLVESTATNNHYIQMAPSGSYANTPFTVSAYVKAGGRSKGELRLSTVSGGAIGNFDLGSLATSTSSYGTTFTAGAVTMTDVGNGWFRVSFTATTTDTNNVGSSVFLRNAAGGDNYTGDGVSGLYVWGVQAEPMPTATRYQRVTTATDYDSVGFPHYLKFDGVDDFMVTNSIDFTATDKMTVWAGVTKLNDAAVGALLELSANSTTSAGSFGVFAPITGGGADFQFRSGGSAPGKACTMDSYAAPVTAVLTGIGDIAGDNALLRVNGVSGIANAADQGTGNYGNYPLYLGRRAGTSLPFPGYLHQLIIRGAASTAAQIASGERLTATKQGRTL